MKRKIQASKMIIDKLRGDSYLTYNEIATLTNYHPKYILKLKKEIINGTISLEHGNKNKEPINKISDKEYRVITLNELGTKLSDVTVTSDTVNTHYKIKFLPKTTADKLSRFYITFLFHKDYLIGSMQDNKILYNNEDKTISFWSQNEFGN